MLKPYLQWGLARFGYELRRTAERAKGVGRYAFRDMMAFTKAGEAPVIFDVGANTGTTVAEFRRRFASATIHSFEPSPDTFSRLLSNVGALPGVFPNNFALGSRSGSGIFVENESPDMSSFLPPGVDCWGKVSGRKVLPISTLDDYCAAHNVDFIDILKSDTQGYELEVLKGASETFACNRVHMVYLEIIFSDMYEGLPRFDEVCRLLLDSRFRLVSFYDIFHQNGRASWTDALFINSDFDRSARRASVTMATA
jgi:FkbM family methyltransferase